GLAPAAAAGSATYTLPSSAPAADGYVLSSTTGGVMSWVAQSGGGGGGGGSGSVLAGTNAALPAAATAGRAFFATDAGILYRDTGTAWVASQGLKSKKPTLASTFASSAWVNQGSTTITDGNEGLMISKLGPSGSEDATLYGIDYPTGPFTLIVGF